MRVLLTGGGTGGHITPLLAVAETLKKANSSIDITYVGDRGSQFASMTADSKLFARQYRIFAGKFRRYHGESWLRRIFDVKTNLQNVRDCLYVVIGFFQSLVVLRATRPDVILLKGGFVGVPVGLAATLLRIPFVTHDSDAVPGLANRLVGRWAQYHATGLPVENYAYPRDKTEFVGVLVGQDYAKVSEAQEKALKQELGLPESAQYLFITGGSLGAQAINEAMAAVAPRLLEAYPKLYIKHQAGRGKTDCYGDFVHERLEVLDLVTPLYRYTGAADVVVARAGANTLAELGVQGKASIIVPHPQLTGGHQVKNAQALAEQEAIVLVDEADLVASHGESLEKAICRLLDHPAEQRTLGAQFHDITPKNATQKLADLLLRIGGRAGE